MKACPAAGTNLTFELWLNLCLESLEASHPKRSQRQVWHDVIFCLAGFLMPLAAIQQDSRSFVTEAAASVHKTACLLSFVHSRQADASVPDFWCPSTCVPIRSLNSWSLIYSYKFMLKKRDQALSSQCRIASEIEYPFSGS